MDRYTEKNAAENRWPEMVDAMEKVASLPHDDGFCEAFTVRQVQSIATWKQDTDRRVAIETNTLTTLLKGDEYRAQFLSGNKPITVIADCQFTLSEQLKQLTREPVPSHQAVIHSLQGSLNINSCQYNLNLTRDGQNISLKSEHDLTVELTPAEIGQLCISLVHNDESQGAFPAQAISDSVFQELWHAKDNWQNLGRLLSYLGNSSGSSTERRWAIFYMPDAEDLFVSQITTQETPWQTALEHFVQAQRSTELFADQFGFDNWLFAVQNDTAQNSELAFSRLAETEDQSPDAFILRAMKRYNAREMPCTTYYSSRDASSLDYACHLPSFPSYARSLH